MGPCLDVDVMLIPLNPDLPPRLFVPSYDPFIYLPKKRKPKRHPRQYRLKRRHAGAKRRQRAR